MYEVFIKTWYHAEPKNILQEEVMYSSTDIEDAMKYLNRFAEEWIEIYPIYEMGIRENY